MKNTTRLRLNTGVLLGCDVIAVAAGTVGLVFHSKELKDGKTYDVLKDGVRDFSSGFLIGVGTYDAITTIKNFGRCNKLAKAADAVVDATAEATAEIAKEASDAIVKAVKDKDSE